MIYRRLHDAHQQDLWDFGFKLLHQNRVNSKVKRDLCKFVVI
jgi:hypothetical protein